MANRKRITLAIERKYLDLLSQGVSHFKAAQSCGLSYVGIYKHRMNNPEFDELVKESIENWDRAMVAAAEDALYESLRKKDGWAIKFVLQYRDPERWGESYVPPSKDKDGLHKLHTYLTAMAKIIEEPIENET